MIRLDSKKYKKVRDNDNKTHTTIIHTISLPNFVVNLQFCAITCTTFDYNHNVNDVE